MNESGFVYFMQNKRNKFVKIGFSKNPQVREKTLQSEEPEIELIGAIPGNVQFEKELHLAFAIVRVRGEWFDFPPEIVENFRSILNDDQETFERKFGIAMRPV